MTNQSTEPKSIHYWIAIIENLLVGIGSLWSAFTWVMTGSVLSLAISIFAICVSMHGAGEVKHVH